MVSDGALEQDRGSLTELDRDGYLSGLPSVRTVLDLLAVAEPLRRDDLAALAGEDAVGQAEAAGAVTVGDFGAMVYPAHPLYTDRARVLLLTPEAGRALRSSVVEHLAARPSGRGVAVGDQLRLAALAADSDARCRRRGRGRGPGCAAAGRAGAGRAARKDRARSLGRAGR